MPYKIKNFSDTTEYTVDDHSSNTDTVTIPLIGRYEKDFPELIAESLLWVTEKFSSSTVDIFDGPELIIEAENEPANPQIGQLWYDYGTEEVKFYDGAWISITSLLSGSSTQHIDNTRGNPSAVTFNPHGITKNAIGLGNVNNVAAYDKILNFNEYQPLILDASGNPTVTVNPDYDASLSLTSLHLNLGVLGKSDQYSKAQADSALLSATGIAVDSLDFDGFSDTVFMKSSAPVILDTLVSSGTNNIVSAGSTQLDSSLIPGRSLSVRTIAPTGGSSLVCDTLNNNAALYINLLDGIGSTIDGIFFDNTGLEVGFSNDKVFHEGAPMTAVQIGALPVAGTAVNTLQLAGSNENIAVSSNTIVKRDSLSNIFANDIDIDTTTVTSTILATDEIIYREDTATPDDLLYGNLTDLETWLDVSTTVQNTGAKAWIRFDDTLSSVISFGCIVVQLGVGEYRVTLTGTTPPSFTPIVSPVDDGDISPVLDGSDNGTLLNSASVWSAITGANQVTIRTKLHISDKVLTPNPTTPTSGNNTYEAPRYAASKYTVAIYY